MKAVLVNPNHQLYIGEALIPQIESDEILVKVKATALNRADLMQKIGQYPPPPGASDILGLEIAGVVDRVGAGVTKWKPGDRVCALLPGGGYAEYAAVPEHIAMPIPEPLSFEQAAGIPEVFLTAYLNMFELGGLKSEHTVLIHAGASGVGTAAIQLVKAIGAKSIVTTGTEAKRTACLALGADLAINYNDGPFMPKVLEYTNHQGVQLILDFVGAPYWEQNIGSLGMDGRLILLAVLGGPLVQEFHLGKLMAKRIQVIGSTLRSRSKESKIAITRAFSERFLPAFATKELRSVIDSVWTWDKANEAHEYMEKNQNIGKIVLAVI